MGSYASLKIYPRIGNPLPFPLFFEYLLCECRLVRREIRVPFLPLVDEREVQYIRIRQREFVDLGAAADTNLFLVDLFRFFERVFNRCGGNHPVITPLWITGDDEAC